MENLNSDINNSGENREASQLTDVQVQEMIKRKNDFLSGKTTSRSWDEIKQNLLNCLHM